MAGNQVAKTGNTNTAVAKPADNSIKGWLQSETFIEAIRETLPRHLTPERMSRVACTALMRNPKLAKCTQASFFKCMLDLSQWGLEPDGRRAHLIPFENRKAQTVECTLIIDYKGLAELVYRSGLVSYLHADVVREGDLFVYDAGELKQHVPHFLRRDLNKPAEPGEIYAVYCKARMKDGGEKVDVLSLDEVLSIRDNSQGYRAFKQYGGQSPWDPKNPVSEQEMMKKTAFRRLSKWMPLSAEIRDAVEHDDDVIDVESRPVGGSRVRASELNQQFTDSVGQLGHEETQQQSGGEQEQQTEHGDAHEVDDAGQGGEMSETEMVIVEWEEAIANCSKKSELGELNARLIGNEKRLTNDMKMPLLGKINARINALGK